MTPFCSLSLTGPQLSSTTVALIFLGTKLVTGPLGTIEVNKYYNTSVHDMALCVDVYQYKTFGFTNIDSILSKSTNNQSLIWYWLYTDVSYNARILASLHNVYSL